VMRFIIVSRAEHNWPNDPFARWARRIGCTTPA
jgi:hypothetical protein